jgi:putative pyruvate formate lyase activating enzyme
LKPASTKLELLKTLNLKLRDSMKACVICPRRCGADRSSGKLGYCKAGNEPRIYSFMAHHGEEPPISGSRGSGTIFFSHCNMRCVYCQNHYFSQRGEGRSITSEDLARIMIKLQDNGCHNINLVTPTHYMPQIMSALEMAIRDGLNIPIVYNTSGYELPETIRMLEGIVDIYLPDMRYSENNMAVKYSDAPGYVETDRLAIIEMFRQAGNLALDDNGIATRGMIIRLLAIPNGISGTIRNLEFIKNDVSSGMFLSIMSQYTPTHKALDHKELSRRISGGEYKNIVDAASELGLNNGWIQEAPKKDDDSFLGTNIKPNIEL